MSVVLAHVVMKFSLLYACPFTLEIGQPSVQRVRLLPRDEVAVMALPTDPYLAPRLIGRAVTLPTTAPSLHITG